MNGTFGVSLKILCFCEDPVEDHEYDTSGDTTSRNILLDPANEDFDDEFDEESKDDC